MGGVWEAAWELVVCGICVISAWTDILNVSGGGYILGFRADPVEHLEEVWF